ncbi:MAG: hypothetical protein VX622_15290, partial [Pseudomonadota bacterium]|nr:hypothetical protein [Pseudomonadota bacterium]
MKKISGRFDGLILRRDPGRVAGRSLTHAARSIRARSRALIGPKLGARKQGANKGACRICDGSWEPNP